MARYKDVPDELKIQSEAIEPAFAYIINRLFAQAEHFKKEYGPHSSSYVDALENLWQALKDMSRLVSACQDATHAQVAINNNIIRVGNYIERELGFNPVLKHRELEKASFRNLVEFDLEFNFGT